MNLKKKYGNYELHPQMKITGYENEIWDEKKEIIEELKRAVQEKQKEKKTCILSFDLYPGVRKEEMMELANALQPDRIFDIEDCAKDEETLLREFNDYITDDRVFGIMCHKAIDTWFESEKLETMKKAIETECMEEKDTNGGLIVIVGTATELLAEADVLVYCDLTRWEVQLRGRVGRSNRTSYAFLMYRRNKMLKEVAEKRLHAIREFTEMGSGFKIAMRDLEIRGAGNLLGAEQSGHMESVGYDLYCKMLAEAVQEAKGIAPAEAFETTIDLNVSAYIPDSYISNEALKLDTYKRIAAIENKEEYEDMTEELTDRFGEPPKNVQNLLAVAELKALAHCAYVTELKQMGDSVRVTLQQHAKIDVARIPELLQKYRDELKFQMESLAFVYTPRRRNSKEKIDLLEKSHALVEDLLQITQE